MTQAKQQLYWNIHKKCFSVRLRGKVIEHTEAAVIYNPEFVVNEAGRQRVLREKRKNVHAYIASTSLIVERDQGFKDARRDFYVTNAAFSDYSFAVYNPYDDCDHHRKGCFRIKCVIGEIFVENQDVRDCIKMVYAYIHDGKPQLKVKLSD